MTERIFSYSESKAARRVEVGKSIQIESLTHNGHFINIGLGGGNAAVGEIFGSVWASLYKEDIDDLITALQFLRRELFDE